METFECDYAPEVVSKSNLLDAVRLAAESMLMAMAITSCDAKADARDHGYVQLGYSTVQPSTDSGVTNKQVYLASVQYDLSQTTEIGMDYSRYSEPANVAAMPDIAVSTVDAYVKIVDIVNQQFHLVSSGALIRKMKTAVAGESRMTGYVVALGARMEATDSIEVYSDIYHYGGSLPGSAFDLGAAVRPLPLVSVGAGYKRSFSSGDVSNAVIIYVRLYF